REGVTHGSARRGERRARPRPDPEAGHRRRSPRPRHRETHGPRARLHVRVLLAARAREARARSRSLASARDARDRARERRLPAARFRLARLVVTGPSGERGSTMSRHAPRRLLPALVLACVPAAPAFAQELGLSGTTGFDYVYAT